MNPVETSSSSLVPAPVEGRDADALRRRAKAIRQSRRSGTALDTREVLSQHPELRTDKVVCLDLAYEEYWLRRQRGEALDALAFCARFPSLQHSLRRMLALDDLIGDDANVLSDISSLGEVAPPAPDHWPEPGEVCGDFTLRRELGRGAFAHVFLATEASTGDRLVVVKLSEDGADEARTQGPLTHPHIVPILSARVDPPSGLTLVCMPYLGSATLEDVLDHLWPHGASPPRGADVLLAAARCRAAPEDAPLESPAADPRLLRGSYADGVIHLGVQLAETLAFLHRRGICHRDLKPSNVLLTPDGRPLLLDFNLSDDQRRRPRRLGGTLPYMAPEQIQRHFDLPSSTPLDERGDLFSLGVILYELLTGTHPFGWSSRPPPNLEQAILLLERQKAGFRPLRSACPGLERSAAAAVERCLSVNPADRPPSADELAGALQRQFTPARRLRRWLVGHRRLLLAVGCLFLVLAAAAGHGWSRLPPYAEREYQRGKTAFHDEDYDAAERHFDEAVQAAPDETRYRFARGVARLKQSKHLQGDAEGHALLGVPKDIGLARDGPLDGPALALRGYIENRIGTPAAAVEKYDKACDAGFRPAWVLNNRAYTNIKMNKLDNVQKDLDEAARLAPRTQAVFHNRAVLAWFLWLRQRNSFLPESALDDVERAFRLGPATPFLYRDAAYLYAIAAFGDLRCAAVLNISLGPLYFDAAVVSAINTGIRGQRTQRALSCLRRAIEEGLDPASLQADPVFQHTRLSSHPGYAALLRMPKQGPPPPMDPRLLDPVLDLPD